MENKKSVYDIAMECTIAIYGTLDIDKSLKVQVLNMVVNKLREGLSYDDFNKCLKQNYKNNKSIAFLEKELNKFNNKSNFLVPDPNNIYIHNELIIVNAPPKKIFDYDSGKIEYVEEEYFFENVASYTIEDLYKYVSKQNVYKNACFDKKRTIGSLNYLVKIYGIETVLFMLDCGEKLFFCEILKEISNVLDIKKYYKDAVINLNAKKTALKQAGFLKVIPRKRNG